MPKRRVWNQGTELRYEIKAHTVWAGRGAPSELTNAVVRAQTRQWGTAAGRYKDVRDRVRSSVFGNEATRVNPIDRAKYYAFAQRLYKLCVLTGEATPERVIEEFIAKSDTFNTDVMDAIVELLTPGQKETVARAAPG